MAIYAGDPYNLDQLDFTLYTAVTNKDSVSVSGLLPYLSQFIRQDDASELQLIESMAHSAIDYAEQYMGRFLSPTTITGEFKHYLDAIYIPYAPKEIVSLQGEDINGNLQNVAFTFSKVKSTLRIDMTNYAGYSNFVVVYKAGWDEIEIPNSVKFGLNRLTATMYESRQDEIYGVSAVASSVKTDRFFDLYRLRGV